MEKSAFRTADEIEARRVLHEAIGRFAVAFELVIRELRSACRLMLERSGLKNQPLAEVILARSGARELTELVGAMYKEFRPSDVEGATALAPILDRIDKLRLARNDRLHAAWSLGISGPRGKVEHIAHSLTSKRTRSKGRIILEMTLRPEDFDKLTTEATILQVYGIRLCQSINQSNLPLAKHLNRPI